MLLSCGNKEHKPYWTGFYSLLRRKSRCNECVHPTITEKVVNDYIKNHAQGYELIDLYSKNKKKFIKVKCQNKNHDAYEIAFVNFKSGTRCRECHQIVWNDEKLIKLFKDKKFEILNFKGYAFYSEKYKCIDDNSYMYYINIDNIKYSNPNWLDGNPYVIENIKLWIKNNRPDYELLSDTYNGVDSVYEFQYIGNMLYIDEKKDVKFKMILNNFLHFQNVNLFNISTLEKNFINFLEKNNINYKFQYSFEDLKYERSLFFDFAIFNSENQLKFLIEIQGRQHYRYTPYFHKSYLKFTDSINRDFAKEQYCLQNNIKLLKIKYNEIKKYKEMIKNEFFKQSREFNPGT